MEFKHFSHPHNLRIYQVQQGKNLRCSGCHSFCSSGSAYGCAGCQFFLDEQCGNANRAMQHPSHSLHHLTLIPYSTYSAGAFMCNACGTPGNGFSFCCALCEFDLHVDCASLPLMAKYEAHPHELSLTYALPYNEALSPECDICHKILDSKLWTYNCNGCNFHVHSSCATMKMRQEAANQANTIYGDEPAMKPHFGSHEEENYVPIQNKPKPTASSSSGRPYPKTQSDLYAEQLIRINASLNMLGSIG